MIDAASGGVQRFSYNRCDPHVVQRHNRAIRINRNLRDAVIVKEPAIVTLDGRKKDLLTCGDTPTARTEMRCATAGTPGRAAASATRSENPSDRAPTRFLQLKHRDYLVGRLCKQSSTHLARGIRPTADTFASFALFKFAVKVICGD
jgi:hypothetical protein